MTTSGSGKTGRTSGIVICCCSGAWSTFTSSMLIIYMPAHREPQEAQPITTASLSPCFVSNNGNRCDFRLSSLRQMNFHQAVFQFCFCALVIDWNAQCYITPEMAIRAFDAQVSGNSFA